jgi:TRAP-type C4-dicarboxylate transport system permease small subunit
MATADRLTRLSGRVNRVMEYLLFGLGLSMALVVAVQVFCRYVLNASLFWSEELARYMLVWLSFFGATVAYHRHLHPGVDLVVRRLGPSGQKVAAAFSHLVCLGLGLVMVVAGSRFAWFVRGQVTPALGWPKWLVLAILPLAGLILALHALAFFLHTLQQEEG